MTKFKSPMTITKVQLSNIVILLSLSELHLPLTKLSTFNHTEKAIAHAPVFPNMS